MSYSDNLYMVRVEKGKNAISYSTGHFKPSTKSNFIVHVFAFVSPILISFFHLFIFFFFSCKNTIITLQGPSFSISMWVPYADGIHSDSAAAAAAVGTVPQSKFWQQKDTEQSSFLHFFSWKTHLKCLQLQHAICKQFYLVGIKLKKEELVCLIYKELQICMRSLRHSQH